MSTYLTRVHYEQQIRQLNWHDDVHSQQTDLSVVETWPDSDMKSLEKLLSRE